MEIRYSFDTKAKLTFAYDFIILVWWSKRYWYLTWILTCSRNAIYNGMHEFGAAIIENTSITFFKGFLLKQLQIGLQLQETAERGGISFVLVFSSGYVINITIWISLFNVWYVYKFQSYVALCFYIYIFVGTIFCSLLLIKVQLLL